MSHFHILHKYVNRMDDNQEFLVPSITDFILSFAFKILKHSKVGFRMTNLIFFCNKHLVHFSGCQNSNIVMLSKYFNVTLYQPQVDRINDNILVLLVL